MRAIILGALILGVLLLPCLTLAQPNDYSTGHGYSYFGAGAHYSGHVDMHLGGGGEFFFSRHVGAGAEVGYAGLARGFTYGDGIFSADAIVRIRAKDNKNRLEPFFALGYSHFFPSYTRDGDGPNVGAGINWWFKERLGFRFELRDSMLRWNGSGASHFVGAHIGLTFR